jgi:hypothetical protein
MLIVMLNCWTRYAYLSDDCLPLTMERGYLQQRAELSHFDDSAIQERRRQEKAAAEQAAAMRNSSAGNGSSSSSSAGLAVPGNDGVVYDPTHHAADYAGLVNRDALERTHYQGATQQHMAPSEFGYIAPAQDASTFDHQAGAGRKHYEGDVRFQSREIVPGTAPMFADPSFYVSGGQDSRFESTAMAAANQAPTDPRSFADNGQHGFASGKKHLVPAFEAMDQHRHARGVGGGTANYPGGGMGVVGQPFSDVTNNGRGSSYTGRKGLDAYAQEAPVERGGGV